MVVSAGQPARRCCSNYPSSYVPEVTTTTGWRARNRPPRPSRGLSTSTPSRRNSRRIFKLSRGPIPTPLDEAPLPELLRQPDEGLGRVTWSRSSTTARGARPTGQQRSSSARPTRGDGTAHGGVLRRTSPSTRRRCAITRWSTQIPSRFPRAREEHSNRLASSTSCPPPVASTRPSTRPGPTGRGGPTTPPDPRRSSRRHHS